MGYDCKWVCKGELARASRPGHPSKKVGLNDVMAWVEKAKAMNIKSIICLLDAKQLAFYSEDIGGLVSYYRRQGFDVGHIPTEDYAPLSQESLEKAKKAFQQLPKPVLVHCSAGCDRTGRVVEFIIKGD